MSSDAKTDRAHLPARNPALPRRPGMTSFCGRLARAIFGFSLVVFGGSIEARAQETAASAATAGACPNDGAAAFADPLNKPHWNGWGVDPSQHRFQPAEMARAAPSGVGRAEHKWTL